MPGTFKCYVSVIFLLSLYMISVSNPPEVQRHRSREMNHSESTEIAHCLRDLRGCRWDEPQSHSGEGVPIATAYLHTSHGRCCHLRSAPILPIIRKNCYPAKPPHPTPQTRVRQHSSHFWLNWTTSPVPTQISIGSTDGFFFVLRTSRLICRMYLIFRGA